MKSVTPVITMKPGTAIRSKKTINISVDEKPQRVVHLITNNRSRDKFIKQIEKLIRGSEEYKEYIKFLKTKMHMDRCYINPTIMSANGKKYSIELHHEPFTLYDLVDIEIMRRESEDDSLDKFAIAETVMSLHYDGLVGLIPLSKTQHELVHSSKVFIPLQHIYQDFYKYYEIYADIIESEECSHIKQKIDTKIALSLKCDNIQSDVNTPEFVYIDVDGFCVPQVPEEWKNIVMQTREDLAEAEKQQEKEAKKLEKTKK
jgi:glycerol-3-phosphate O-acyltransferase